MAFVLKISHSSDITLTTGEYNVEYTPQYNGSAETVTETAVITTRSSNLANQQATLQNIVRAFDLAKRRRDTGRGTRVYIKFTESGDANTYRSELWSNDPNDPPGTIEVLPPTLQPLVFDRFATQIRLTWTRRNYWEHDSETALTLSNGSGSSSGGLSMVSMHEGAVFTNTTVSFAAANYRISDSGSGFAIFAVGDVISLRGSTLNDGTYTVAVVDAGGAYIDVNEPIVDEAAGDTVKIYDIQNYAHIDSASILGDLPAACRVELTVNDASADLETMWIGQNFQSGPETFVHMLDAGDSDTGSNTADVTCTNVIRRTYAIGATEAKVTGWTIPTETLTAANGGYFKVLARFGLITNITAVKWRLKLLYGSTVIWQGGQVQFDDSYAAVVRIVRELDTVQLPPFVPENSVPTDLTLELWAVRTGGAINVDLDTLILLPLDGYRRLRSLSGVADQSELIDDGINGTYYQEIANEQVRDITAVGSPIMLWPNTDNRLYFVYHSETDAISYEDWTYTAIVKYRPRRAAL